MREKVGEAGELVARPPGGRHHADLAAQPGLGAPGGGGFDHDRDDRGPLCVTEPERVSHGVPLTRVIRFPAIR